MTRALVIGGTGFVGAYVVRALAERGCVVEAMPARAFAEAPSPLPDLVVHMGAMDAGDARRAADAFAGKVGRFVVASSADVYLAYGRFTGFEPGPPEPVPLTEDSALRTRLFPYRAALRDSYFHARDGGQLLSRPLVRMRGAGAGKVTVPIRRRRQESNCPPSASPDDLLHRYDKIPVEREVLARPGLNGAVVRLAKVYGRERNADFATVHTYANRPDWRWTHVYVENAAAAIAAVALAPALPRRLYNVGEAHTPSVAERLRDLPPSPIRPAEAAGHDFRQDMWLDSTAICADLGYTEPVPYVEGIRRTLSDTLY